MIWWHSLCVIWSVVLGSSDAGGGFSDDSLTLTQRKLEQIRAYEGTYEPMTSRIAPPKNSVPYTITSARLAEIRHYLMYPYYDYDEKGTRGDLELNINIQNSQLNKQLTFLLPFFGFGFNYTWVSRNGYLGFSDAPFNWRTYPLYFPVPDWPRKPDPSFMAPFYSKCNIGQLPPNEDDNQKTPGVYWRLETDLPSRTDMIGVEIRERLMWDIREGIVGSTIFTPKHAIIITWKNVTFAGGSVNTEAKYVTNTFQLVIATDEIRSYAIFNYEFMKWTSHTEAGGSVDQGQGGVSAFVGFNAGNGTRAYEYTPYSQSSYTRDLAVSGYVNGKPGRHIFRIDEVILAGNCRREEKLKKYPLVFSPEHGNMMGGSLVNVTGPCFETSYRITCQFDVVTTEGQILNNNTAACIMPPLLVSGYVDLGISVNGGPFYWSGKFLVETPLTAPEGVWFTDDRIYDSSPDIIEMNWLAGNLTLSKDATVTISLWGYRERSILPEFIYIDILAEGVPNANKEKEPYTIVTGDYANRDNGELMEMEMGFIMINLTVPEPAFKLKESTVIWSRPIPLAWYFQYQWTRLHGKQWQISMCEAWIENDRNLRNFAYEVQRCPCLLSQAISDRGRFIPDFACDKDGNTKCFYHYGAEHCVRSALPNKDGSGQQCCYDRNGYLMMTADQMWGGHPHRAHNLGKSPFDEANKVPSVSHWYHDIIPFYTCCKWQSEQSSGCVIFRFERRTSQDCVGYQPPTSATVFGDPHMYTFDDVEYTFNGLGEFVLVRVDSIREVLDIQGRFERIPENYMGSAKGSLLTAVAARDNVSSIVEIRKRPSNAMWRYHLDVIVDGKRIYFDRFSQKIQQFRECIVYTPSNILNQSQVIVMFSSGAGIEVVENLDYIAVRVYLPITFTNITRGLFGNWTFDPTDDFVLPDGSEGPSWDTTDLKVLHDDFGMQWVLDDKEDPYKGKSLFFHEETRSSNYYYHPNFHPEFNLYPQLPSNGTTEESEIRRICGKSYQCNYDYVVTLKKDFAFMTKYYQDQFVNIKHEGLRYVISCGALSTPPHGRKSSFNFLSGAEVKFDCDPGYVLLGEQRRWCYSSGEWNWPETGEATCITEDEYLKMQNGIVAGIVLAIILPLILAFICFLFYCRERVKKQQEEGGEFSGYKPPTFKNSFLSKMRMSSAPVDEVASEDEDTRREVLVTEERHQHTEDLFPPSPTPLKHREELDIVNSHPKVASRSSSSASSTTIDSSSEAPYSPNGKALTHVYYTNEPVNDRSVEFENVLWGVEEGPPSSRSSISPRDLKGSQTPSSQESAV